MQPNYNFYGAYPYQQQPIQTYQQNQIIFVNSLEEVHNYIVHSNKPMYFRVNTDKPLFVEKKVDMAGNILIESYELVKCSPNTPKVEYATAHDVDVLKNEILRLKSIVEGKPYESTI